MLSELTDKKIDIIPFSHWKQKVITPLAESSPLYPLTLYFQDNPSEEIMHFETALGQAELMRHGIEYPKDYSELLRNAFDKTLRGALGLG